MHHVRVPPSSYAVVFIALCLFISMGNSRARAQGACEQIRATCESAGFVAGGAKVGLGVQVDCIIPIMQGTAQRPRARRPLPPVDTHLIAVCAANRPGFGQPNPRPTEAMQRPEPAHPPAAIPRAGTDPHQDLNAGPSVSSAGRDTALQPTPPNMQDRGTVIAALPPDEQPETGQITLSPKFRRTQVDYVTKETAGTIIVDTPNTYLYLVLGNGKALRYGIGVGREGFTWSGAERISRMAEWPDWYPPTEMIERQPYLPRFMAGGETNPLGARALYLGNTLYRIHGTNQPSTIGTFVSSGCIRLTNEDIIDLYNRIRIGTRVLVLPAEASDDASPRAARFSLR
jgi:lipoprotein-anchoring transpeptidase ErfK/SrfK